jgi:hypothetical protein
LQQVPFDIKSYFETQYLSPPKIQFLHLFYIITGRTVSESFLGLLTDELDPVGPKLGNRLPPKGFLFEKESIKGF